MHFGSSIRWDHVNKTHNGNKLVEEWSPLFSAMIEKYAPIREMRVSDRNCPWLNSDLKALLKPKDKLKTADVKHKP